MKDKDKIQAFNRKERTLLVLIAVLFISFLILLGTMFHIQGATHAFQQRASDIYFKANQSLGNIDAALASLVGLYHAQESLNSLELITFTQELLNSHHDFDAIFYLPLVPLTESVEFEKSMRDDGFPEFRIRDSSNRDLAAQDFNEQRLPIGFVEPLDPDSVTLLGIDLLSNDELRPFLQHAIVNGGTTFSGIVKLLKSRSRIYGFKAVYEGYFTPESLEERLNQAQGVFAVEINLKRIFKDVLNQTPGVGAQITLSMPGTAGEHRVIFEHQPNQHPALFSSILPDLEFKAHLGQTARELTLGLYTTIPYQDLRPAEMALILLISIFLAGAVVQVLRFRRIAGIRERMAQDQIFTQRARAEATLHSISEAIITTDVKSVIEYMNPMAEQLTGWSLASARGRSLTEIFELIDERSGDALSNPVALRIENKEGKNEERALMRRTDGKTIAVVNKTALLKDRQGKINGVILVTRDVSLEELSQRMAFLANHDPLTQLANRRAFDKALLQAVEDAKQKDNVHALCYIDLDHFKMINDSCGHMAGDRLLTQVTSRLKLHVRRSDVLARLGGDEFALLLSDCPIPKAMEITEEIRKDIKDFKLHWNGKVFSISTSIGIVAIDASSISSDNVIEAADSACYIAKQSGRNQIQLYHPNGDTLVRGQNDIWLMEIMQGGLHNFSFALFLQAMRSLEQVQKEVEIHEFLLRLPSENGAFISPSTMIDSAKRYNKMFDIDCWVIRHAFQTIRMQFQAHPEKKASSIYSINISGQSLQRPDLVSFIKKELDAQELSSNNICFEIAETSMIANLDQALLLTKELRSQGYHMALDDFGTGPSSFSYLKKLPFDFLKIDGSFVRDSAHDPVDRVMVDTINHIGEALKMHTIAEWVEDKATFSLLNDLGVNFAQGFFIAKPEPAYPTTANAVPNNPSA